MTEPTPHPLEDDISLVHGCIAQEPGAWAALVQRHETTVFFALRNAFRLRGAAVSDATLEELQAEVFFRLVRNRFTKLRQYRGRCRLSHWLKVVSGNFAIDRLRKRGPDLSLDDPQHATVCARLRDPAALPDARLERREAREILHALWDELAPADRRFVRLFYQRELSFEEVAEAMETTVGAVYSRKNRVRKKLATLLRRREKLSERRGEVV